MTSVRGLILCIAVWNFFALAVQVHAQEGITAPQTGYALVNGLKMYYEIHGNGFPLILIHGGLGSSEMFGAIVPELAKKSLVITVDMQAHGRTGDIDRPMSYQAMAAILRH